MRKEHIDKNFKTIQSSTESTNNEIDESALVRHCEARLIDLLRELNETAPIKSVTTAIAQAQHRLLLEDLGRSLKRTR